jgi:hypothetical protein
VPARKSVKKLIAENLSWQEREKEAARIADKKRADALAAERKLLERAVRKAVRELKGVRGVTVINETSFKINWWVVTVRVEEVRGESRPADDVDPVPYVGYVVRWSDGRNQIHGGHCHPDTFRAAFASWLAAELGG